MLLLLFTLGLTEDGEEEEGVEAVSLFLLSLPSRREHLELLFSRTNLRSDEFYMKETDENRSHKQIIKRCLRSPFLSEKKNHVRVVAVMKELGDKHKRFKLRKKKS